MWAKAAIAIYIFEDDGSGTLPAASFTGTVKEATSQDQALTLIIADDASQIQKPIELGRFGGTGGIDGPADWDGKIKTRMWGWIWNRQADPIDKANNIYCLADPTRKLEAIDAVRDKGAEAAALTTLAWQGSAASTFTALQNATAPEGGGVICASIACIKWWTQPAGSLTADLRGENAGGFVASTAQIAEKLVEAVAGPDFASGTVSAAALARPATIGWVVDNDQLPVAAMLDELLSNVSLLWLVDTAGDIVMREWKWGPPAASAKAETIKRVRTHAAMTHRSLGYRKNELPMARRFHRPERNISHDKRTRTD